MSSRNNIKVLYIITHAWMGGALQSFEDMLCEFEDRIKPVVVIPEKGNTEGYFKKNNIEHYIVPFTPNVVKIGCNIDDFADTYEAALTIKDIIDDHGINIVHINSSTSNVGAIAAILSGIPYVWHIRELLDMHYSMGFSDEKLTLELMEYSGKLIAISETVKRYYWNRYRIGCERIYNGFVINRYLEDVKHYYPPLFLIAGNVTREKGQIDAIYAVEKLINEGINDIELHLVGMVDIKIEWRIKKYVELKELGKNIIFWGFKHDLSWIRKRVGYAITSSKMEALGRVTVESMLAGNIVIGANEGGTAEIIGSDGERGFLYTRGNVEELADTMKKVMNLSSDEKKEIAERAQKYAVMTFNNKDYAGKIESIYSSMLYGDKPDYRVIESKLREKYESSDSGNMWDRDLIVDDKTVSDAVIMEWLNSSKAYNDIQKYLSVNGVKKILIYGLGAMGGLLYDILNDLEVEITGVIDRSDEFLKGLINIIHPDAEWPDADVVIVSVFSEQNSIVEMIRNRKKNSVRLVDLFNFAG